MFILARGTVEVLAEKEGRSWPVGILAAGDCFGEISLLTGEPRSATLVAVLDCEVIEIERESMAVLLREYPGLAESLSETVVARRSAMEMHLANAPANGDDQLKTATKESFLRRLRQFFQL
jgi:CRP-like cAMP-binding protein